ncbi:MAG: hypothetical protein V7K48_19480 [Nostoc sp.]|uniref:hypothetical protein n=1 Tax=Nostoc sp. TaxID=1180 RepID=UPI002FF637B4
MPTGEIQQLGKIPWRSGVPGAGCDYLCCQEQNLDARTKHHRISEALPQLRQLVFSFFFRSHLTFKTVATNIFNLAVLTVVLSSS